MPCLKVATNTTLYDWMRDDMDLNAGTILDGTETVEQVGQRIFEFLDEQALAADLGQRSTEIAITFGGHAEDGYRALRI
jgi:altronate dehydratase